MDSQKFSDNERILTISFNFSQRESVEVRDEERVENHGKEIMGARK
jgi:hypothetical protein